MRSQAVLLLLLAPGCSFFFPDMRSPADRARELTQRCRDFTEEAAAPLLSPVAIDSVEPAYAHVQSGPSFYQARMRGARIHMRPIATQSRESIARSLECHQSRVVLGTIQGAVDDPYALSGRWLDQDVDSAKDGFIVQIGSDDMSTAREVLDRAKRYAATAQPEH
jgi:hypothetical protein